MITDKKVIDELNRIAKENGGLLFPEKVVEAAAAETSPLHPYFDWEDSEAAAKWRLHQARCLIKVTVRYIDGGERAIPMRAFVSLTTDRYDGGGYRPMTTVLATRSLREQLLADALAEMESFRKKYESLVELAEVFDAMRKARKKIEECLVEK